jgi:hypothetical protein
VLAVDIKWLIFSNLKMFLIHVFACIFLKRKIQNANLVDCFPKQKILNGVLQRKKFFVCAFGFFYFFFIYKGKLEGGYFYYFILLLRFRACKSIY